jgi:hypothetical protein
MVQLMAAAIDFRDGVFARWPDILYKADLFTPEPGSTDMAANIVDVRKARAGWLARRPLLEKMLGPANAGRIDQYLTDIEAVASDEYMVHEAGHALGRSTDEKQRAGYFKLGGKSVWPLIYMEELRADLLSFGFAADLLPPDRAAAVFLYNVFLRFGVHFEALARGAAAAPYGSIPFVLFRLLRGLGWLDACVAPPMLLRLTSLDPQEVVGVMRRCSEHARIELLQPEFEVRSLVDLAIHVAGYQRAAVEDSVVYSKWTGIEGWLAHQRMH